MSEPQQQLGRNADSAAEDEPASDGRVGLAQLGILVREATAVLLAILVAFGLDAWWDARTELADLEDQLEVVGLEVEAALEEVERTLLPGYIARKERFLALRPEDAEPLPADSAGLVANHLGLWTFDANVSTLRSIASSAVLNDHRPELVPLLLTVASRIDDLEEEADRVERWRFDCTARLTDLGIYESAWLIRIGRAEEAAMKPNELLDALLGDQEYRSCIAAYVEQRISYSEEVEAIRTALLEVRLRLRRP